MRICAGGVVHLCGGKRASEGLIYITSAGRYDCVKAIANIDDFAIWIWAPKVIDELSQIDDI